MELTPYINHLKTIKEDIKLFQEGIQSLLQRLTTNTSLLVKTQFIRQQILKVLQEEVQTFWNEYHTLHSLLQDVSMFAQENEPLLSDRRKRSIIPFVCRALSLLFGVSTEENVNHLRESLIQMGNRQDQIVDVLSHGLTLFNKTNAEVQLNRNALLRVANATSVLQQGFIGFYNEVYLSLLSNFLYVHTVTRLHGLFNIISSIMRQMHLALTDLLFQNHWLISTTSPFSSAHSQSRMSCMSTYIGK